MSNRSDAAPISVVIPALDAGATLPRTLEALVPAAVDGLVAEVIVSDGGSKDATHAIAEASGARVIAGAAGRGAQLRRGGEAAKGAWLLFLHADTALDLSWTEDAKRLLLEKEKAGVFTLAFDTDEFAARVVAAGSMIRTRAFASPYGDQGLLISRALYEEAGSYAELPLMEDVEFIHRLVRLKGRGALRVLPAKAVTSAERYQREGYARQVLKNAWTLIRYAAGTSPEDLARDYR